MSIKGSDLNKTWIASGKANNTFNANSSVTIPYGRYRAVVSGKGMDGTNATPSTASAWTTNYNTNYNVAYPIATQPVATQPATAWTSNYNTNYNVAYPVANQPVAGYNTNYNTNYNVAYPVANQPATAWATNYNTNYNVAYPVGSRPIANQPATAFNPTYAILNWQARVQGIGPPLGPPGVPYDYPFYNTAGPLGPYTYTCPGGYTSLQGNYRYYIIYYCVFSPGNASAWTTNYNTNYNVAYPVGFQPVAFQPVTGYSTNYNVAYPIATRPVAGYGTNYSTNYNVAYPIATQPVATQPATAWTTNYNTNYNVAYPIATQPIATQPATAYNAVVPAAAGTPTNVLGVSFPGGASGGGIAPTIAETEVVYYSYPDGANYPVTVYGGTVRVNIA